MTLKYRGNKKTNASTTKCPKCGHKIDLSWCDSYRQNGKLVVLCPECETEFKMK